MTGQRAVCADARLYRERTSHLAVVRYVSASAANICADRNSWVMICNQALGGGPRTVLIEDCRGLSEAVSAGEIVSISGTGVAAKAGLLVTWEGSPQWVPEPPLGFGAGVGGRVVRAEQIVAALGRFMARPLISGPVRELRAGCHGLSRRGLERAVADLVGLGPGLTPAGDDYLGGYLAALLHISGGNRRAAQARMLIGRAMETSAGRTHPLSEFLLGEYRAGMIPEFLTSCLRAVLHPSTGQRLASCVQRVLSHGATSGTEMMLGLLDATRDYCPELAA